MQRKRRIRKFSVALVFHLGFSLRKHLSLLLVVSPPKPWLGSTASFALWGVSWSICIRSMLTTTFDGVTSHASSRFSFAATRVAMVFEVLPINTLALDNTPLRGFLWPLKPRR
jgi:hypothetical protein